MAPVGTTEFSLIPSPWFSHVTFPHPVISTLCFKIGMHRPVIFLQNDQRDQNKSILSFFPHIHKSASELLSWGLAHPKGVGQILHRIVIIPILTIEPLQNGMFMSILVLTPERRVTS